MEEAIRFYADRLRLNGTLHRPDGKNAPIVIGAHGMLSTGESPKQRDLADRLNACGIAYFRFDHRGCGRSEGRFADVTTFDGRCNDLIAAIETVKALPGIGDHLGLFGSSMGGAVCLAVAGDFSVRAMVTLAAPVRFTAIQVPLSVEIDPDFEGMTQRQMQFDIGDRLARIQNILIVHGDADRIVPFENAEEIYRNAKASKQLFRIEGADHPLSLQQHQARFMEKTVEWFKTRIR